MASYLAHNFPKWHNKINKMTEIKYKDGRYESDRIA